MVRIWCALALAAGALAQTPQMAPQLSPEEAAAIAKANKQLNDELTKSDQTKVMGNLAGAIKGYEEALARVKSDALIKNREEEVLQRLSAAYIAAQRPKDAVRVSTRVLSFHVEDCKPGAERVEFCADAQYALGLALMHAGDFAPAVTQLKAAAANFAKVGLEGDVPFRMSKLKERGDAESLLAAALFRAGQRDQSIAMFRQAIATLKIVAFNEQLDPGTRGSARKSITDAQSSLDLLEKK